MTISRRSLMTGFTAGPLAAAVAGVSLPGTAMAAPGGDYRIAGRVRPRERRLGRTSYRASIAGLAGILAKVSQDQVLANANRTGGLVETAEGRANIAEEYAYGFHWDVAHDQQRAEWRPQGVTTSYDDFGGGSTLYVSWYARGAVKEHGARISIVGWRAGAPLRYRHVLLVEPYRDSAGRYTYAPVDTHAGGIAAYGGYLYVADTYKGLRVFDLSTILVARDDRAEWIGLHGNGDAGDYYSYGYKYLLPQVGAYDNAGRRLRFSAVSVDRTTSPHSLLVSEYDEDGRPRPNAVRWPLAPGWNDQTGRLAATEVHAIGQRQVQGAASVDGTYYLSVSAGQSRRGRLMAWRPESGAPQTRSRLSAGPEDLSYDGRDRVVWTVGEYDHFRYAYAVDPTA
ncbi:hypothetical protein LRS74_09760 [Streptomyces sp. LX-29]|uniref:hypothetical protein n=1 Tax=Streptomyces sp. LX-29 TaxID=2900152 RepID=UPI00240D07A9|nr:hypothetical protein [Streptomyces sp. LX-29]WFB07301.1 hypothetical protein LRS74_09760 [Streptomyces sp. LX-29]